MVYYGKSDIGHKRLSNEDCYGWYICDESEMSFFIIADGMGGYNAGEVASSMAVERFLDAARKYKGSKSKRSVRNFAINTLKEINCAIYDASNDNYNYAGMGTTSVISIITPNYIIVANVGDSRAYFLSDSERKQLTIDHSYIEYLIRNGLLDRDLAKEHPDRNIITRALGVAPEIAVDTFELTYKEGDLLIMCSDGLNSMVSDEMIYKIASKYESPEEICDNLINEAKINGGNDNITIIVVRL
ncbi:MAG: Stp1/IreP family PP2C-type Ser/Thr phosphatase [Clostridiaceae bacterium]|nr:Stp1/IreP family PP2C-type Ser/Thr phosphatase [Clostridiaceae bacterium]